MLFYKNPPILMSKKSKKQPNFLKLINKSTITNFKNIDNLSISYILLNNKRPTTHKSNTFNLWNKTTKINYKPYVKTLISASFSLF